MYLLKVQRDEVPHGEERTRDQEHHEVGCPDGSPLEHRKGHEGRLCHSPFVDQEPGDQACGKRQGDDRLPRAPADARGADDTEHERGQAAGHEHGSGHVERLSLSLSSALLQVDPAGDECHDADRDVDEQDPAPGQLFCQNAAEEGPGGAAGSRHCAPNSHCTGARLWLPKRRSEDRQRGRREDGAAEALNRTCSDQHRLVLSEASEQAGEREHREPDEEDAAPPEEVGGAPTEKEETGERQGVRVQYPLELRRREAQAVLDRRQCHIDDRDVQQHHELSDARQGEDHPVRGAARCCRFCGHIHAANHSQMCQCVQRAWDTGLNKSNGKACPSYSTGARVGPSLQPGGLMNEERARELLGAERTRVEQLLSESVTAGQEDRAAANEPGDLADPAERLEETDDAVVTGLRERLAAIVRAEHRIEDGTFGLSVSSGVPIPDDRLEADPAAELTVEEAQQA